MANKLDLALITYRAEGMARLAANKLPEVDGVRYVVSWQEHSNLPIPEVVANRDDIVVYRFDKPGLSNNRNNAIEHCDAEIILISDDDVTYTESGFNEVISAFELNPDVDVATFISERSYHCDFPHKSVTLELPLPTGYHASSIELAFRRRVADMLQFNPLLGLNSPCLHGGEDEIFLLSAIRRGLKCVFFPRVICSHIHESTGSKQKPTQKNIMASGCVIALYYPWSCVLRIPLKALRMSKHYKLPFFRTLIDLIRGAMLSRSIKL